MNVSRPWTGGGCKMRTVTPSAPAPKHPTPNRQPDATCIVGNELRLPLAVKLSAMTAMAYVLHNDRGRMIDKGIIKPHN